MDRRLAIDAVSSLPGSTATAFVVRSAGALSVTIVVKATFAFAADSAMPRVTPQEILRKDVHYGKMAARSVRFTTDLVPYLGRADVLFTGYGYSHGAPVDVLRVRLAIFDAQQSFLNKGLILRDPSRFERMPIVYERAFGGPTSADNPLGVGAVTGEPTILDSLDPRRTAGFGPIARTVPARAQRLGSTPRDVIDGDSPDIPEGFDWSYFQAAPVDQQIGYLRGDEWIALDGLHPTQPRFQTKLPTARGHAGVYGLAAFGTPDGFSVEMRADTLRIDGGEQRCTLVWRGSLPIADEAALAAIQIVAGVDSEGATRDAPAASHDVAARGAEPSALAQVEAAAPPPAVRYASTVVLDDPPAEPPAPVARVVFRGLVPAAPVGQVAVASVISRWRGDLRVTAVAKATFAFAATGEMTLIAPVPIVAADVHHADNPMRSIRETGDLAPHRERVDVLFAGHAYAPPGQPAPRVAVRLALAGGGGPLLDKRLDVLGDRSAAPALPSAAKPGEPAPFQRLPIVYERAFGGIGYRDNPLGIGLGAKEGTSPNVVYPDDELGSRTAGFGPIGTSWPARKALLGRHPAKLLKAPVIEIPDDFAWAYFQAAPDDQRIAELPPRTWVVLEGLHPQQTMLQMRLPVVHVSARLHGQAGAVQTITLRADTLFIDGDAERCTITFRGSFTAPSVEALEGLFIQAAVETPAKPVVWPDPPSAVELRAMREPAPRAGGSTALTESGEISTVALLSGMIPRAPPLPFVVSGSPSQQRSASAAPIPGAPWAQGAPIKSVPMITSDLESTLVDRDPVEPAVAPPPPARVPMAPAAIEPSPAPPQPVVHMEPPAPPPPRVEPKPAEPERRADPWAPQPEPAAEPAPKAAPKQPALPRSSQPLPKKPLYGKFGKS